MVPPIFLSSPHDSENIPIGILEPHVLELPGEVHIAFPRRPRKIVVLEHHALGKGNSLRHVTCLPLEAGVDRLYRYELRLIEKSSDHRDSFLDRQRIIGI